LNRDELERRIWGKTIAWARRNGIISETEAQYLVDENFKDFQVKHGWDGKSYVHPLVTGSCLLPRVK